MNSGTASTEASTATEPENISKAIISFINNDGDDDNKTTTAQATDGKQFHDRRDIIQALTKLQLTYKPEYTPGDQVVITDEFKHALLNSMAKIKNSVISKSLSQIDGRTIEFVEMLFAAFLNDNNISDAIKSLLLELQVAIIKTTMMDKNLFGNTRHPARNVLDTIAHLGIGMDDSDNTLFKTIGLIIEQLNTTYEQNITSFNTALIALNRLKTIEKNKSDEREAETRKEFLKEHARQTILTELKRQTKNKTLPPKLKPLILKHWSNLMLNVYIKSGNESEEWKDSVDTLKDLINSLQEPKTKIHWMLLKSNAIELVDKIKTQLYNTKQDKKSIDESIICLQKEHEKFLSNEQKKEVIEEEDIQEDESNSVEEYDRKLKESKEHLSKLPGEAKLGTWFEVYTGEYQAHRRLKLSIILYDDAMLVFVDRVGNKVLEKHATEFLKELENNQSRLLVDESICHHALNKVIGMLTKS
jgi:Protein of unknown function (DUF1631)